MPPIRSASVVLVSQRVAKMSNPPFLPIGSDDQGDSCLAKHTWFPDATTHSNEVQPAKEVDGLKYRKREDPKTLVTSHTVKPTKEAPPTCLASSENQQCSELEQIMKQTAFIIRSLDAEESEMKSLAKIDVKTPREEDLTRLIQKSDETEANLSRLYEAVRASEERATNEKRTLLEGEREVTEALAEAKQSMDSSVAELTQQMRQYTHEGHQCHYTAVLLRTGDGRVGLPLPQPHEVFRAPGRLPEARNLESAPLRTAHPLPPHAHDPSPDS